MCAHASTYLACQTKHVTINFLCGCGLMRFHHQRACGQVMRGLRLRCDDPGCVADHVQMTAEAKIDPTTKVKTANLSELTRLTTFDFACGTDRQLVVMKGQGWCRFDHDVGHDAELHDRPRATICWDMGPDNLCFPGFLLYHQRISVSFFFSAAHKVPRCSWNSVSRAVKFAVVCVGTIIAKLELGPFQEKQPTKSSERARWKSKRKRPSTTRCLLDWFRRSSATAETPPPSRTRLF